MNTPVSPVPTCSMQPRGMQSSQLQPKFCSEVEPAVCRSHPAPQPSVPRAFPERFPAPAGSLRHMGMILQALGMLSLPACPSPELLGWLALHPGLAKPSLSTSAGNWASPVGSSAFQRVKCRNAQTASLHFVTPQTPCSRSQMRVCSSVLEVMDRN